ncbi:Allophanate hydrolase 2 subunit 1 (EC [Olavius algarvensis associated proteobacterium Delta 3]|nr:Allophanate hydrolase 2 subunit 1 (EC [Olavius algarvensis associated proteobacterium Delta 3]CAB5120773.1 Allophanate hydrolase 2 subunit 1 (EC [Olavius algarvensis associated proteobacterium Delta 3]
MASSLFEKAYFRIAGDCGLLVEYGDAIDPAVNQKVRSMAIVVQNNMPDGVREIIPTYRSILIYYDPLITNPAMLKETLTDLESGLSEIKIPPPKVVEIPVCYGGDYGPDIEHVAQSHNLTLQEVIDLHSEPEYLIYMVGFTPGFPFLGGLPEVLHTPRLKTPRTLVPRGSVGIANGQTGVYPIASPGGWQLIGRTPISLFSPERSSPILYQAGDRIRFKPTSPSDYQRLSDMEDS